MLGRAYPGEGGVVLTLKAPYRDGTTHIVMSPLAFLQRLAALVPRPRLHLIRFHGLLAPDAKLHSTIIPSRSVNAHAQPGERPQPSTPSPISWARLLKRVFDIDLEQCPQCGSPLTISAAIEDRPVINKIFTHLGLSARAPSRAAARALDRFQLA